MNKEIKFLLVIIIVVLIGVLTSSCVRDQEPLPTCEEARVEAQRLEDEFAFALERSLEEGNYRSTRLYKNALDHYVGLHIGRCPELEVFVR